MKIFVCIIFFSQFIFADDKSNYEITLFPKGRIFQELSSNQEEARIGLWRFLTNAKMKVEMGGSSDLISFQNENQKIAFGIDFFAYGNVIGANGLHLQIDAIDGFFGGHISYVEEKFEIRFRGLHHSAHLVDGNWWITEFPRDWKKKPIPFTTDFGEIVFAKKSVWESFVNRPYIGIAQSFFNRPNDLKKFSFFMGDEIYSNKVFPKVQNKDLNLFASYHLSFLGVPKYVAQNNFKVGSKLGNWNDNGINFFLIFFTGRYFFGQYYNENIKTIGLGFNVDFQ